MESNSLPKSEVESFSPKGTVSKGEITELSEASPPTKGNTNGNHP